MSVKDVRELASITKKASRELANLGNQEKNQGLLQMAAQLRQRKEQILEANQKDLERVKGRDDYTSAFVDRLTLSEERVDKMAAALEGVAELPDPIGENLGMHKNDNGLLIGKVRVPIGLIGIIYEARPNVTSEASALTFKSGNGILLRGSSEAHNSNLKIVEAMKKGLEEAAINPEVINLIPSTDRSQVMEMLALKDYLDAIVPRGGKALIDTVVQNSKVPVIETGEGNCHIFVDQAADVDMARAIVYNAKTDRPGVCNAVETVLIHQEIAEQVLPPTAQDLKEAGVTLKGCARSRAIFSEMEEAEQADWATEYLDLVLAVKIVNSLDEAIQHIQDYGTLHSEAIITENYTTARTFLSRVDAAAVYVNASTRFTDGGEFGMGAELGISTQKLHARGPMGLEELTSTKFVVLGTGQIR